MAKRKDCYTDEEKDEILAHVMVSVACGRFVSRVFREDEYTPTGVTMPNQDTFYRWILEDDNKPESEKQGLSEKLVRAREYGIEALLDDALVVAATPQVGETHTIERIKPADTDLDDLMDHGPEDLVKTTRADMTAHRKLYIETVIKLAQMMKPKKYGPKLDLTSDGHRISAAAEIEAARLREQNLLDGKTD